MMRIIYMAKETYSSLKSLEFLLSQTNIKIVRAVLRKSDNRLQKMCRDHQIIICTEAELINDFVKGTCEAEYIFSFYWRKVKAETLKIPTVGCINFHPGPLPEARGSGYHVAILENWGYFGVTAHFMDEEFDTGEIIECRRFPISSSIMNRDLVHLTHEKLYILFQDIVKKISQGDMLDAVPQEEGRYFSLSELETSKKILSTDTVEIVDRKIRAFWNPPYSGAQIEIQGKTYTVINEEILRWIADKLEN